MPDRPGRPRTRAPRLDVALSPDHRGRLGVRLVGDVDRDDVMTPGEAYALGRRLLDAVDAIAGTPRARTAAAGRARVRRQP